MEKNKQKQKIIISAISGTIALLLIILGFVGMYHMSQKNAEKQVTNAIDNLKIELEQQKEEEKQIQSQTQVYGDNVVDLGYEGNVNYLLLGNSFKMFPSQEEAVKYAKKQVDDISSPHFWKEYIVYSIGYKDGVMQWTVGFY